MGLAIAGAASRVEAFEPGAVGRERPPAVERDAIDEKSASGTSIQTESPSRLISARLSGSANVPPPVATTAWRSGSRSSST